MKNGKHLILDIYNGNKDKLSNIALIKESIISATKIIEMRPLSEVFIYEVGDDIVCSSDIGITGGIIFIESHLTIHTFPEKRYVSIDIYSCKTFNHEEVAAFFENVFEGNLNINVIIRGSLL